MGPIAIGLLTFATTMAGALLGWWIGRKADIRQHLEAMSALPPIADIRRLGCDVG